jgi:hypothetical protein
LFCLRSCQIARTAECVMLVSEQSGSSGLSCNVAILTIHLSSRDKLSLSTCHVSIPPHDSADFLESRAEVRSSVTTVNPRCGILACNTVLSCKSTPTLWNNVRLSSALYYFEEFLRDGFNIITLSSLPKSGLFSN